MTRKWQNVYRQEKNARNASQSQRANFDVHGMLGTAMFSKPPFRNSSHSASNLKMLPWQGPEDHEKIVKLGNVYKRRPGMTFPNEKKKHNYEETWKTIGKIKRPEEVSEKTKSIS